VRRRICLLGAALSASPLAFGVVAPAVANSKTTHKTTPAAKAGHVTCTTNVAVTIAAGDTGVTPPAQQGTEYGTASCGKLFGPGVQTDKFTVADTGDTVADYTLYFRTGSIHGTYDLTPQEGAFNFLAVDYLGTLKVAGGTGAFQGMKGTGDMTCTSLDGIHTTCKDKLKLKP
jgi:hypothetical protein